MTGRHTTFPNMIMKKETCTSRAIDNSMNSCKSKINFSFCSIKHHAMKA